MGEVLSTILGIRRFFVEARDALKASRPATF